MEIVFKTKRLQTEFNDEKKLSKNRGKIQAKLIMRRLTQLRAAPSLQTMRNLPGRWHELIGDKSGWISADLDGKNRLIFEPATDPIPATVDGGLDWSQLTAVRILGVLDTHERKNRKPV